MTLELKDSELEFAWHNAGRLPQESGKVDMISIEDVLAVENAPLLMPKVISNVVKEAAEPLLVGTSLLTRINFTYGQTITFPAVGAMHADDVAQGQEYPEQKPSMGGATVTATIGKSGLAVKVTDEMVRYSQFDIINMLLRAAGRALARHKEKKIFNLISALGVTAFDNQTPGQSVHGVTTGRALDGAGNGSVTMDDIFDAFAQVMHQGFMPDTLLMHPLTWTMFVKDPTLRAFALASGGGTFFANWTGSPNGQAPWANSSQGGLGVAPGQNVVPGGNAAGVAASGLLDYPQTLNSAPVLPSYLGLPLRIIVTPFVNFDPVRKLTDIYIFDSRELGALVVDEDVTTEEWSDPARDLRKIKLRERYSVAILNEGQAVATLKNVKLVANEVVLPAQTTLDVSSNVLGPINPLATVI